jgi:DGQHR domain-containing protein
MEEAHQPVIGTIISQGPDGCYTLEIPTPAKLGAIVDGQHRLFAFVQTKEPARLNMELLCSIYLDLPKPFQAQLFATINLTQKPVDKGRRISWQFFLLENSTRTRNRRFMAGSQSRRVGTLL